MAGLTGVAGMAIGVAWTVALHLGGTGSVGRSWLRAAERGGLWALLALIPICTGLMFSAWMPYLLAVVLTVALGIKAAGWWALLPICVVGLVAAAAQGLFDDDEEAPLAQPAGLTDQRAADAQTAQAQAPSAAYAAEAEAQAEDR